MRIKQYMTRREFVKDAAIAGAGLTIVPRHVLGKGMTPPSDLLNIAAGICEGRGNCRRRLDDCAAACAWKRDDSAERFAEYRGGWRWRNGPHKFDQSGEPKYCGAVRCGLGLHGKEFRAAGQ